MISKSKTFEEQYEISDEEKEALIQLIAHRYIDFVNVAAFDRAKCCLEPIFKSKNIRNDDILCLTFKCTQVVADVLVELSKYRRQQNG